LVVAGGNPEMNVESIPFNIEKPAPEVGPSVEGKPSMSSSSTVVTNTSASVGGIGVAPVTVQGCPAKDPPLQVVRTDDCVLNSEDETGTVAGENMKKTVPSPPSSPKHPSSSFTDKLIKDAQSRQGRSLQRWLVHSQTESLVREVAGTIPITKDGRIVLVSASRKKEWILPKGGWDSDETKEECAIRETYEEGGLLGKLGACLAPIDYESGKSKKRRLESSNSSDGEGLPPAAKKAKNELKESNATQSDSPPESPKLSFIRLLLFPMYLTEVKSEWPEKGRLRKLVDIDEAIRIMEQEDRLYFKKGLEIVKDLGLHLVHQTDGQSK
jgi:diphosphoinositol-polyphosphate diphosphatase